MKISIKYTIQKTFIDRTFEYETFYNIPINLEDKLDIFVKFLTDYHFLMNSRLNYKYTHKIVLSEYTAPAREYSDYICPGLFVLHSNQIDYQVLSLTPETLLESFFEIWDNDFLKHHPGSQMAAKNLKKNYKKYYKEAKIFWLL